MVRENIERKLHKPVKQRCVWSPNQHRTRAGTTSQALSFRQEPCAQLRNVYWKEWWRKISSMRILKIITQFRRRLRLKTWKLWKSIHYYFIIFQPVLVHFHNPSFTFSLTLNFDCNSHCVRSKFKVTVKPISLFEIARASFVFESIVIYWERIVIGIDC